MGEIEYREAVLQDGDAISGLIMASQRQFCFHEYTAKGQELMADVCGRKALKYYLERGDVYFVAESDGRIIGVVGIRDNKHLAHNFVEASWHRQGISKRLWDLASAECLRRGNPGTFGLRASTYAIPVYLQWGFVQTGPTDHEYGITSTPMKLDMTAG
jgi:GNAT superfamily N-acetyltransferase